MGVEKPGVPLKEEKERVNPIVILLTTNAPPIHW
jgi:hypothetical protein